MDWFDPYYTWLGIRPEEQPPHHYRLLGLQLFEENLDAIEHAADRQMAHLRTLQTGKHAELSQRLLNEVASAKVCLLHPEKKTAYDAALREQLAAPLAAIPVAEPLAAPFEAIRTDWSGAAAPHRGGRKPPSQTLYLLIAAAAVVVVILGLLLWPHATDQTPSSTVVSQTSESSSQPSAKPKPKAEPVSTVTNPIAVPPPPAAPPAGEAEAPSPPVTQAPPPPEPEGERLPIGQWVDLLPYADLEWGRAGGDWSRQADGIVAGLWMEEKAPSRLALPVEIDGDYDVEVELTRTQRDRVAGVILPVGPKRVVLRCDMKNRFGPVSGLEPVDGKSAMQGSAAREGTAFTTGQRAKLTIEVRLLRDEVSIHASIDGKPFLQWTGPQASLSPPTRYWALPGKNPLGLTNSLCAVTFHSIRLRLISGKAIVTRPVSNTPPAMSSKPAESTSTRPEATSEKRRPFPSAADQEKAAKQIDEVYQLKQNRSAAQKAALAKELLAMSRRAETTAAEQFVLLHAALDAAREGGDVGLMLQAIDALGRQFEIDLFPVRVAALVQFAKDTPEGPALKGLVEAADRTIAQALADNRYDLAMELAEEVYRLGQKPQAKAYRKQTYDRRNEVKKLRDRWQAIQQTMAAVKTKPDDPEANLAAGRWCCFEKGDWRQGLPHLAKGNDDTLKALAVQELTSPPREPADQVKLADAWLQLAQSMDGRSKDEVARHAGAWYRQAELNGASGLLATKITKELKEIARLGPPIPELPTGEPQPGEDLPPGVWIDVLKWADVDWGPPVGRWARRAEEIVASHTPWTPAEGHSRLALPIALEGDYDLRMEFTRTNHPFMVGTILPVGSRQVTMVFDQGSPDDKAAGLEFIDGKGLRSNPTTKQGPPVLTNGQRYTVLHQVRLEGDHVRIEVLLNGQPFLQWMGPQASLMVKASQYDLPGENPLGLVASGSEVTFHVVRLRLVSGKATRVNVTRNPPQ